ncbi:MAG TPA: 3-isopropylmalate dehydratase small subunit [Vicinamibacterales bacterium]|nr:3-isopropylmalate dehydratase small subunit [Vicinamibacterales bacterium]
MSSAVALVTGRAISLPVNDIDTDRIMPARFLKAVTFEGLEAHLFEDDRREAAGRGQVHPFDDAARRGARVFLTGVNFGCGSSREHAPQALSRWGIRAVVGVSFAEIFAGNSLMIGLACVQVSPEDLARLRAASADPAAEFTVDLSAKRVSSGGVAVPLTMPEATREALMSGAWDATGMLLENYDDVQATAQRLPYISGF